MNNSFPLIANLTLKGTFLLFLLFYHTNIFYVIHYIKEGNHFHELSRIR